jgi:hypothetical protein
MTTTEGAISGFEIADALPSSTMPEASRRLSPARDEDHLNPSTQTARLLDAWRPSDRQRLGFLSTRSYENTGLSAPSDVWSYQRMFIEQRRDGTNPFGAKPVAR